ncbi:hypothetical protein BH10CYA1_BH10CYA1_43010 [soil metagenome]
MWKFIKGLFEDFTGDTNGAPDDKQWIKYSVDDSGFTEVLPNGSTNGKKHLWSDVLHVGVLTTDDGPWIDDVFFVIKTRTGDICIPSEDAQVMNLLQKFERLPGFQWEQVVEAMGSVNDQSFACWDISWTSHAA